MCKNDQKPNGVARTNKQPLNDEYQRTVGRCQCGRRAELCGMCGKCYSKALAAAEYDALTSKSGDDETA